MPSTIAVEDLRVGMFIFLDLGWLSHPFPLSSFRIVSADQIATLRGLKLAHVRWSPEKSDLSAAEAAIEVATDAPAASEHSPAVATPTLVEVAAQQRRQELLAQREATQRCERQHAEASRAWREASDLVGSRPQDAGRNTEQLTRAILDKMLGDDDIGIRLVAGGGDRLAAHALNVTVISLLIARTMGFTEAELLDLAWVRCCTTWARARSRSATGMPKTASAPTNWPLTATTWSRAWRWASACACPQAR